MIMRTFVCLRRSVKSAGTHMKKNISVNKKECEINQR